MNYYYDLIIIKNNRSDKATENVHQSFSFEFEWDGRMLENLFTIALNTDKLKLAWSEFERYSKYADKIHGEINEKCISNLFEAFLAIDDIEKALVKILIKFLFSQNNNFYVK